MSYPTALRKLDEADEGIRTLDLRQWQGEKWFERNALPELFELTHQAPCEPLLVLATNEVVSAELRVGDLVAEDVVGSDEDRMRDGDDRLAVPAAALDTQILGVQVGVFGAPGGALGGLDQSGSEPAVALAGLPRSALASRFVVAGADGRPARGVAVGGKAIHVGA